ncbi:MAG: hypothetical protein KY442_04410 [Proteobacteria bacterium]|nr:hypothetical protein [Pseudomonadota bacterium]
MSKRGWWALLLAGCLTVGEALAADDAPAVDPVWGQYASVVGRSASAGSDGYTLRWYWTVPGQELAQEYLNPGSGTLKHRDIITPGETPGSLVLQSSYLGKKQWHGTVQPDGQVLFVGKGLLKLPYLAGFGDGDAWQILQVELDDGRIASVDEATRYNRFLFAGSEPAVADDTAAANDTAAATPPAGVAPAAATVAVVPAATATAASAGTAKPQSMLGKLAGSLGLGGGDAADGSPPVVRPDFGVMEQFIGQRFVYHDWIADISTIEEGRTLVIQFGSNQYHLRATADPNRFEVPVHPADFHGAKAQRLHDGTLEINLKYWSVDHMLGQLIRLRLKKNDYGAFDITSETNFRFAMGGWEWGWSHNYQPYTTELAAEQRKYAQWEREDRAQQARENAIQQAESDAAWNRAMSTMTHNLADYAAREQQRMDDSQAMLDEINAMARAEAEAQRYAEQQAAQQYAAQRQTAQQLAQQQQAAQQQALAQQQAAMRDRQSQLQARPAQSAGGTGSWEHAGSNAPPTSAGNASTRDHASTCISPPVTSRHRCASLTGYKGMVSNSCAVPVDVKMCFMTATGWNCQSNYGLGPQQTWEPGWCHASTGEVFHSVRYSDDQKALASP